VRENLTGHRPRKRNRTRRADPFAQKKNNPVLIGEPGIGKTAIVEGLAQKIIDKSIPQVLESKRVVEP